MQPLGEGLGPMAGGGSIPNQGKQEEKTELSSVINLLLAPPLTQAHTFNEENKFSKADLACRRQRNEEFHREKLGLQVSATHLVLG